MNYNSRIRSAPWGLFHVAVLYFFLALFIFGSLYHKTLIRNLGFGLFFFISWIFCFILVPWVFHGIDFSYFYSTQEVKTIKTSHHLYTLLGFCILQLILVLIALQTLPFNLMFINLIGVSVVLLYGSILALKKILPAEGSGDFGFAIFKLIISIYASWFLLYMASLILVINFTFAGKITTQFYMLLILLVSLCLTNIVPNSRPLGMKLSFLGGFVVISLLIAYLR